MSNLPFISKRIGDRYWICNSSILVCQNATFEQARDSLVQLGIEPAEQIIANIAEPSVWLTTYMACLASTLAATQSALEATGTKDEIAELRANIDALTDALSDLASEFEDKQAQDSVRQRIAQLTAQLEANLPGYRSWLQSNSIVMFDLNNDDAVRRQMLRNTKLGQEIRYLEGLLNG